MATAKWSTPGTLSASLNSNSAIESLTNGSTSQFLAAYDNSTALDLYATVLLNLTSITPSGGGTITLRVFSGQGTNIPDYTADIGGGDPYTVLVSTSTSAKIIVFPMIRLYPQKIYIAVSNNCGADFGTGNTIKVQPFDEASN